MKGRSYIEEMIVENAAHKAAPYLCARASAELEVMRVRAAQLEAALLGCALELEREINDQGHRFGVVDHYRAIAGGVN